MSHNKTDMLAILSILNGLNHGKYMSNKNMVTV